MTDARRAEISKLIQDQKILSASNKEATRESLMRSGLYRKDGTLKEAYGGKKADSSR